MAVTGDLVIIAILFVIAVMLTRDRSRAWLLAQVSELRRTPWSAGAHPGVGARARRAVADGPPQAS